MRVGLRDVVLDVAHDQHGILSFGVSFKARSTTDKNIQTPIAIDVRQGQGSAGVVATGHVRARAPGVGAGQMNKLSRILQGRIFPGGDAHHERNTLLPAAESEHAGEVQASAHLLLLWIERLEMVRVEIFEDSNLSAASRADDQLVQPISLEVEPTDAGVESPEAAGQ